VSVPLHQRQVHGKEFGLSARMYQDDGLSCSLAEQFAIQRVRCAGRFIGCVLRAIVQLGAVGEIHAPISTVVLTMRERRAALVERMGSAVLPVAARSNYRRNQGVAAHVERWAVAIMHVLGRPAVGASGTSRGLSTPLIGPPILFR